MEHSGLHSPGKPLPAHKHCLMFSAPQRWPQRWPRCRPRWGSNATVLLGAVAPADSLMSSASPWHLLEFHCLCARGRGRGGGWAASQLVGHAGVVNRKWALQCAAAQLGGQFRTRKFDRRCGLLTGRRFAANAVLCNSGRKNDSWPCQYFGRG